MGLSAVIMFDVNDDAKVGFRRIELLTGPERRRRWSAEDKARIVQESLVPGARVADVARRWQLCPQQVFAWRREARDSTTEKPSGSLAPAFVPIVAEDAPAPAATRAAPVVPVIEVELAGAVVRVVGGQHDGSQLTAVLRAVRASASRS
jgi:transposase